MNVCKVMGASGFDVMGNYKFPDGIPGFEEIRRFRLIGSPDTYPLVMMAGVDMSNGFLCVSSEVIEKYEPEVELPDLTVLGIESQGDLWFFNIITVAAGERDWTVNLGGPVVINPDRKVGRQVICGRYPVRHRVWNELIGYGLLEKMTALKGLL